MKRNQEGDPNQRGNERYENKIAWQPHKTACMAVPTSTASEHGSELNDRINKWSWGWGSGTGGCKGRKTPAWEVGARDRRRQRVVCRSMMGATVSNYSRSEHLESASPYNRSCDHMIMHLQQPAPSCSSSPPCTRRPCPGMAGGLMSAVVRPAGNLDCPSWSWCPADV